MTIDFMSVQFNPKDALFLRKQLDKLVEYTNFDEHQNVRVFCNKDRMFTAFEGIEHNIGYTSRQFKMIDTIKSPYIIEPMPFNIFYERVLSLS